MTISVAIPQPDYDLMVDESQPTTTIQIRLLSGSRLVGKFNHFHTIKDIKAYINKYWMSSTKLTSAEITHRKQIMTWSQTFLKKSWKKIKQFKMLAF